jgi:cytochrome c biogenesis protein CcdA
MENVNDEQKKGSPLLIALGFTFVILGGLFGIFIGYNFTRKQYDKRTRIIGWVMLFCGCLSVSVYQAMVKNYLH